MSVQKNPMPKNPPKQRLLGNVYTNMIDKLINSSHLWPNFYSHKNQSVDLHHNPIDWCLCAKKR